MNHHIDTQRLSLVSESQLKLGVENAEQATVTIIVAPALATRIRQIPSSDHMGFHKPGYFDDDFANATWEDAEWQ